MRETKITADHLKRDAYLYVRQSSPRQVTEHNESTQRQYALRNRAIAAGWPVERIRVIDCDLGKSASIAPAARDGFQQLVSEVALGKAGIVMGLEASRLARKSSEWHRLIELCGMTATLLADEDGFYDPVDFNDRLVLGLKGTMSEAESHTLRRKHVERLRYDAEAAERAVRSACRPSLTAAARAGCWIRRPGRKNAPQGPNQRMERQGDDRGCRRRRGASGPPTTTAFRFPFPHAVESTGTGSGKCCGGWAVLSRRDQPARR